MVVTREHQRGDRELVAYVVGTGELLLTASEIGSNGVRSNQTVKDDAIASLKIYLKGQLPDYMIPRVFIFLDALLLTTNGKIDCKVLPDSTGVISQATKFVPPKTEQQIQLATLFAEVLALPIETISLNDSFFALGGHSLLATQLVACFRQQRSIELPLQALFEYSTIAELDAYLLVQPLTQTSKSTIAHSTTAY